MKKIYVLAFLILGMSCDKTSDLLEENFERGGMIQWETIPEVFRLDLSETDSEGFAHTVEDPNNNIISYDLQMTYDDVVVENFLTLTNFPTTLSITVDDVLAALSISLDELDASQSLSFLATITTTDGVFSAATPDWDFDTNTNNGGQSGNLFYENPAYNQAISFSISFYIPPPEKIRGTSFEEPFPAAGNYVRTGGALDEGYLENTDAVNIMYQSVGTSVDDEVGFTAEFIDNGTGDGFSSEAMGVTSDLSYVGFYSEGSQGYALVDVDGLIKLEFDRVAIPDDLLSAGVQIQYFLPSVTYESSDRLNVYALVEKDDNTSETRELFNMDGTSLNGLRESWKIIDSGLLSGVKAYTLFIEYTANGSSERVFFDQMLIYK